ncbi:MAG: dehydrogenase [Bacteroidia bacterium]|nr:dehydrogenase [Bacteroidia bacterium]
MIRAKAPLRLGLAGGGTDVSPYSDQFGGAILNATVDLYAYTSIQPLDTPEIILESIDQGRKFECALTDQLTIDGNLDLLKGVYNHVRRNYPQDLTGFHLTTFVDAPMGSGMGSSSTITVSILGAFVEWLKLPLGEYDIAKKAYEIERIELQMAGGKQDQYAATFGGVNFMEFYGDDKVIVNPLRIRQKYLNELEINFLLYYTGTSRLSAKIIDKQVDSFKKKGTGSLEAAHKVKEQAYLMKEALLTGELDRIGKILDYSWQYKKKMAPGITNEVIDNLYESAKQAGATGGKISGAGGGGFMMFYCPGNTRYNVIRALNDFGGNFKDFNFTKHGMTSWKV